jgi:hypothetical protein
MKLRRRANETRAAVTQALDGSSALICAHCESVLEPEDDFCASCGAAVVAPASLRSVDEPPQKSEAPPRSRNWFLIAGSAIAGVVVVAGVAFLVFLWLGERSDRIALQRDLHDAQAQVESLQENVASLESELAQAQDLAEARGKVLAQTDTALQRVDPLLSTVDGLTLVASQIQDDRDAFRANASQLRGEMVDFSNYLIETSPFDYDFSYIDSEITYLNGRLDDFDAAAASLDDRDVSFASAADRFERRANSFSDAVRRLEVALKEVSG